MRNNQFIFLIFSKQWGALVSDLQEKQIICPDVTQTCVQLSRFTFIFNYSTDRGGRFKITPFRTSHYLVTLHFKDIAHVFKKKNDYVLLLLPGPTHKFIDKVVMTGFW